MPAWGIIQARAQSLELERIHLEAQEVVLETAQKMAKATEMAEMYRRASKGLEVQVGINSCSSTQGIDGV